MPLAILTIRKAMHTCGSFFYNYGAPLGGPSGPELRYKKWMGNLDIEIEPLSNKDKDIKIMFGIIMFGIMDCKRDLFVNPYFVDCEKIHLFLQM